MDLLNGCRLSLPQPNQQELNPTVRVLSQCLPPTWPPWPILWEQALPGDAAGTLAHHLYYALKALLNMHRTPEERARRLRELCRQWHVGFSSVSGHAAASPTTMMGGGGPWVGHTSPPLPRHTG